MASLETLKERLFGQKPPANAKHGFVKDRVQASDAELDKAKLRLQIRRKSYGWTVLEPSALREMLPLVDAAQAALGWEPVVQEQQFDALLTRAEGLLGVRPDLDADGPQINQRFSAAGASEQAQNPLEQLRAFLQAVLGASRGHALYDRAWVNASFDRFEKLRASIAERLQAENKSTTAATAGSSQKQIEFASLINLIDDHKRLTSLLEPTQRTAELLDQIRAAVLSPDACLALKPLPFYPNSVLLHLQGPDNTEARRFVLTGQTSTMPRQFIELSGTSNRVHDLNTVLGVRIDDETIEEYVWFFCEHVHADAGAFHVAEENVEVVQVPWTERLSCKTTRGKGSLDRQGHPPQQFDVETAGPLTQLAATDDDRRQVAATLVYAERLFRAVFAIDPAGTIEMTEDDRVQAVFESTPPTWTGAVRQPGIPEKDAGEARDDGSSH